jgi:nickel/cobalt transporter (NiCoT) family protein
VLEVWRRARTGAHEHAHVEQLLARRGFMNRLLGGRLNKGVRRSHHMYPVGLLFGLGFDTASEVALLVLAAGAASASLPCPALLALPLLFTAGMTLMDTTDGVLMVKAYRWAFVNPLRKILYNITTTSISVAMALVIGTIQLLSVAAELGWQGRLAAWAAGVDLGGFGLVIVGLLLVAWAVSVMLWRRGGAGPHALLLDHSHEHVHADGTRHAHEHFH